MPHARSVKHDVECVCEWCGERFMFDASAVKRGRGRFCSLRCAAEYGEFIKRGRRGQNDPVHYAACPTCGTTFVKRNRRVYCSDECGRLALPHYTGPTTQACRYCGEEFWSDQAGPRWYCCLEHRQADAKRRHKARMLSDVEYAARHRACKQARKFRLTAAEMRTFKARVAACRGRCPDCGERVTKANPWSIDHYHPRSRGGGDDLRNYRPICKRCNTVKSARLPNVDYFPERDGQLAICLMA
jgi:hypothetical protein